MNETLQKFILDTLRETKSFALSESPEVVRQFLGSEMAFSVMMIFISGAALALFLWLALSFSKRATAATKANEHKANEHSEALSGLRAICLGISVIFFAILACNSYNAYKIKNFPKAYLMEYFIRRK